jgi:signal transduction histidine kinase
MQFDQATGHPPAETTLAKGSQPRIERSADDVAMIVHDMKNPLNTIALETYLIDKTLAEDTSASSAKMRLGLARINQNVTFLDRMVHELLDAAAIDAGSFALSRRPVDLCSLLDQVVGRMVATSDRARVVVDAHDHLIVTIDAMRIERVIANLISNALKYARDDTRILVKLARRPDGMRISVCDLGPGLTAVEIGYVFDRYRRVEAQAHDGTGLGLYLSKQIVEAHGGAIGVDSIVGVGSHFFFDLPAV